MRNYIYLKNRENYDNGGQNISYGMLLEGDMREPSRVMEIFCILIGVVFAWVHTYVKSHRVVQLRSVCLALCQMDFTNKEKRISSRQSCH